MPVTRSAREVASRDGDTVSPKKKAGSWLREQRQKAGLSQMDLANKLGFKYLRVHFPDRKWLWSGSVPKYGRLGTGTWRPAFAVCSRSARLLRSSAIPCPVREWKGMNVVFLDVVRRKERAATPNAWSPAEMGELTRLYHAKHEHGGAAGFAYGETDQRDPQFYVLNSTDAELCTACVSRLIRHSRHWLVIEDGRGNIQVRVVAYAACGASVRTLVFDAAYIGRCPCVGRRAVRLRWATSDKSGCHRGLPIGGWLPPKDKVCNCNCIARRCACSRLVDRATLAEANGYTAVWLADERFYREVYTCLGQIAAHTAKVLVGPCVTDPYARHPALTAMAIATLDEISCGRAILGIGAGISGFAELQIDRRKPARAMREAIALIRALLGGETVDFHGEVVALNRGRLSFPVLRALIPIYVASNGPVGQRMAAETADGVIVQACASVEEVRAFRAASRG